MRFLRKFNEELKKQTYWNSASELRKLGHQIRSFRMIIHSERQEFKHFGKVNLDYVQKDKHFYEILDEFNGDFYLGLKLKDIKTNKTYYGEDDKTQLSITFHLSLIPATRKEEDSYIKMLNLKYDSEETRITPHYLRYSNVSLYNGEVEISYLIPDGFSQDLNEKPIEFSTIYSYNLTFKKNRRFAVILKKQLLSCFSPGEYPPTNMDSKFNTMYDELTDKLIHQHNLTVEYDYSLEDIYDDINNRRLNLFYSE
jgi:hypothetical protein